MLKACNYAKKDKNYKQAICIYENVIYNEGMYFYGPTHIMLLAEFYYKENQIDRVWQYLNDIQFVYPELKYKIDAFRSKILKKEKKYEDALFYLMSSNLFNSNGGKNQKFDIDKFRHNSTVILKKLNMYEDKQYIAKIINIINSALNISNNPYKCEEILKNNFEIFIKDYQTAL